MRLSKRQFLASAGASALTASAVGGNAQATANNYDVIVVGGGNAGLPTAIFAAQRGARVLIIDAADKLGGTLTVSGGRMSAAGTKLQKSMGIEDSPDILFDDVMQLSNGTANPDLLRLFVDHAAQAFDWLMDNGFNVQEGVPVRRGMTHAGQSRPRYVWSPDGGRGLLAVFNRVMEPLIESEQITVQLDTAVEKFELGPSGDIKGVVGRNDSGAKNTWYGRNVVLTSGGYTANSEMFSALEGTPDYSDGTYPYNQGIGIELGLSVGGYLRGGEDHLPTMGGIPQTDKIPGPIYAMIHQRPDERLPWEIWVNAQGDRFIAEDIDSIHKKELALIKQPHERFWVIFDHEIFTSAPPAVNRWTREKMEAAFNKDFAFKKADSLYELAQVTGIDPVGLEKSVMDYNDAQAKGVDRLGRKHMPAPIEKGPFYAIRSQSSQIISFAGLAVDDELHVLRSDLSSIPKLYAAGELLGAGQLMGQCYFGGMMVTPALAFGRLLGREIISLQS